MSLKFCKKCPYKNKSVPDRGNPKSKIVIVASSPTDEELCDNTILTGKALELFNHIGKKVKFTEKKFGSFYFTTSINCSLPEGKFDNKNKIENECCKNCNKQLLKRLGKHPRDLIIAMGIHSARSLTDSYTGAISTKRGILHKSELASIGILPILDPNIVMKAQFQYPLLQHDLLKCHNLLKYGENIEPKSTYLPLTTKKQIKAYIKSFKNKDIKFISADIETSGLQPSLHKLTCIGLLPSTGKENYLDNTKTYEVGMIYSIKLLKYFTEQLPKKMQSYLWHNGKFDLKFLRYHGLNKKLIHVDRDTQVLSYLLDEKPGRHSLERCTLDYLEYPHYKDMIAKYLQLGTYLEKLKPIQFTTHKQLQKLSKATSNDPYHNVLLDLISSIKEYLSKKEVLEEITNKQILLYIYSGMAKKAYALIPIPLLSEYCAKDIVNMMLLHNVLRAKVKKDKDLWKAYTELLIPSANSLISIELNGMPFMQSRVQEAYNHFSVIVKKEKQEVITLSGRPDFNPNSPAQVKEVLTEMGYKIDSTNKKILAKLEPPSDFITHLLTYKESAKMLADNITKYLTYPTKRVHSTYGITSTVTGRLGSTGENNQNVPKLQIIRKMYAVKHNRILISCDYSQAELRGLAVLSNDKNLINIFASGKDLHSEVARQMFGDNFTKKQRGNAKTVNFGVVYGVTAKALAIQVNITEKEAQTFINDWFKTFPVAKKYMNKTRNLTLPSLTTVFGRKRRFHIIGTNLDNSLQNEAGNFLYQSTCSDFTTKAQTILDNMVDDEEGNIKQINIIHDDNIYEMDNNKEQIIAWSRKVKKVMEQVPVDMGLTTVPFITDPAIGYEWNRLIDINLAQSHQENKFIEYLAQDDYNKLDKDDLQYRKSLNIETRIQY